MTARRHDPGPARPVVLLTLFLLAIATVPAVAQGTEPGISPAPSAAPSTPGASPDQPSAPPDACIEPEASAEPLVEETLSMPEDFRIALFDGVWQGIRDYYVDPETNGLDWDAIGDEYAPLVIATDNAHEVYELLAEMVGRLEDPYTNFYSPDELGVPEVVDPSYGGIGALLDNAAGEDVDGLRLVYVFPDSPAAQAGLAARDRIVAVRGDACVRIADIRGPEGTDVTITVASPGQAPRDVTLTRRRVDPTILPEAQRLPADPRVGYLRVIALSEQVAIDGITEALRDFVADDPIEALVIDLRASNQGAPLVMTELLRTFVSGDVGEFHARVGNEPIDLEPSDLADDYAGMPVVVLVDEQSEAEAEQAAAILQDQGRATIVGAQTLGQTHGAQTVDFADGSLLQIVSFGFQLPDGRTLEGTGVTPDVVVTADWLDYPEADDPYLLEALRVIDAALAEPPASASAAPEATLEVASGSPAGSAVPASPSSSPLEAETSSASAAPSSTTAGVASASVAPAPSEAPAG
jgi:carboxyl-terminal processing protease